jgi:DNA-binding Lrp family transcriptional regulator
MDQTDITLCRLLQIDSRAPYHELASRLGLSINAVHKRIKELTEKGIIRAFRARPSLEASGAVTVWIFGRSDLADMGAVRERLQKNDTTYWIAFSGGSYVYIGGYLRDISDLTQYSEFAKNQAGMSDPTIGIMPSSPKRPTADNLRPLDFEIISQLSRDSRKPLSDVAKEVGVSSKTVRRRLDWMTEKRLIDLTIDWYPDQSNDIIAICHTNLRPDTDRAKFSFSLGERFGSNVLFSLPFANLPNHEATFLWTNSMKQMEDLKEKIRGTEGVNSLTLNVLQIGYMSDTWRDSPVSQSSTNHVKKATS